MDEKTRAEKRLKNLTSFNKMDPKKQKAIASKGGKKTAKIKREKRLMSEIYAEFLMKEHNVIDNGKPVKMTGDKLVDKVMSKVLSKGDGSSVSLMKEVREAMEGSKVKVDNEVKIIYLDKQDANL